MAFIAQPDDQNKQGGNSNQTDQIPLIPTLNGAGGPSGGSSGGGAGQTGPAKAGAAPSAPWANIGSYLSSNAPQSKQVADTLTGNFNQSYNDIKNQAADVEKQFTQKVNDNTVSLSDDLFNQAKTNPTEFAKNPNNVAAFQKAFNAQYNGPQNFEQTPEYADLQSKIQQGQKNANLINQGTSGIQTLLENTGKNATPGQTALDTLLLQESPENFNQIRAAAAPFSSLTDFLNGKVTSLDAIANQGKGATGNTAQSLQDAFVGPNGVSTKFQNDFNARLAAAQQQAQTNAQKYQQDLSSLNPVLTQQEAQALNIDPNTWARMIDEEKALAKTYEPGKPSDPQWDWQRDLGGQAQLMSAFGKNFDLSPYITTQDVNAAINRNNFASDADYAEAAALAQLTGQASFLDQGQAKQAGTYNPNLVSFDNNMAGYDLGNKLNAADLAVLQHTPIGANLNPNTDQGMMDLMKDVYSRNYDHLNAAQKAWANSVGINTPPAPPTVPTAPTQKGDTRINPSYNSNNPGSTAMMQYYDGTNWVDAPPEFRNYNPAVGGYTERFNYTTGQYEPIPQSKQSGAGIFRAM